MTVDNIIKSAVSVIPPDMTRDDWIQIGMAIKDGAGENGFAIWDEWSQQSTKYNAREMRGVWNSFKAGKTTVRVLFYLARQHGWKGGAIEMGSRSGEKTEAQIQREKEKAELTERAIHHCIRVVKSPLFVAPAIVEDHPYLKNKRFITPERILWRGQSIPEIRLQRNDLFIPMRRRNRIISAQIFTKANRKLFAKNTRVSGAYWMCKNPHSTQTTAWAICEGFATAHAIRECGFYKFILAGMSGGNMVNVARAARIAGIRFDIIADNDGSGAGREYAEKTNNRYWMPPVIGDAFDLWQNGTLLDALRDDRDWIEK